MPDASKNVKASSGVGGGEPRFRDTEVCVAKIVRACHDQSVQQGLVNLALAELDEAALEGVLTYCAEQACVADGVVCPGCRRESEKKGLRDLDSFLNQYEMVDARRADLRVQGNGRGALTVESLDDLANDWSGEAYWYWARRVLRKLRHGVRRANVKGHAFAAEGATPEIILVEPQLADNIGMVARAMANFGLDGLRLVNPRDGWPNENARIAASGANFVIDEAQAAATLTESIGDLNWVCATTARQRDLAKPILTPEQAVAEMARRIGDGQRCGIVFGRERNGLETDEVAVADAVVMIPVNSAFASINLAQAVLLMGYEWLKQSELGTLGRVTTYEHPVTTGLPQRGSPPAERKDLLGFFEHLEEALETKGFFNPSHKRQSVVRNIRTMFMRMGASKQEVQTLRGIVATLCRARGTGKKLP